MHQLSCYAQGRTTILREEQNKTKQNKEIGAEILKIGTPKIITVIVKKKMENRALEGVFGDNMGYFLLILHKTYVVTPHLNRLVKTVQMRGHNKWF